jgi:transitional endoplasmic reticulum ATPase
MMTSIAETADDLDTFTFIDRMIDVGSSNGPPQLFPKYGEVTSAKIAVPIVHLLEELRAKYPAHVVTYVHTSLNLLAFASAGHATATLDIETDSVFRMRFWQPAANRSRIGHLAETFPSAKYQYHCGDEDFILYYAVVGLSTVQFVLKEQGPGETSLSHSAATDSFLAKIGLWSEEERKGIYVYDMYWRLDAALYEQVQK